MSDTVFTLAAKLDGEDEEQTPEAEADGDQQRDDEREPEAAQSTKTRDGRSVTTDGGATTDEASSGGRADDGPSLEELADRKEDDEDVEELLEDARERADSEKPGRAAHYYSKAADLAPSNATVHREYAAVLAETGHEKSAVRHYERALELEPDEEVRDEYDALLERMDE